MTRRGWVSLSATCISLCLASYLAASPTGWLAGTVLDERRQPLAGARVTVTGPGAVGVYRAVTDASGFFQVPGLPTREPLVVSAEAEGRIPVTYSGLTVREGAVTRRDFRLRPQGWHDVLLLTDARIPYHEIALEGAKSALRGGVSVLPLAGSGVRNTRALRQAIAERPNAIIAIGSLAAGLARREIRDVPVVYTMVLDPVGEDLNVTNQCGTSLNGGFDDQLAVLTALRPGARRVLTVFDPRRMARSVRELRRAAEQRGMAVEARPARTVDEISAALETVSGEEFDAFLLLLDPHLFDLEGFDRVRHFSMQEQMMLIVPDPSLVAGGGTFSYGPGFREMGVYAGRLVEHLFSGVSEPADIGVRFPTARNFTYNEHETKRLGVVIPPEWTSIGSRGDPGAAAGSGSD